MKLYFSENYFYIHFDAKKNKKFRAFFEVGEKNTEKFHVHIGTICKITAPMDKRSGNERKLHLMSKIRRFMPSFYPLNFLPGEFKQFFGHTPTIFLCRIRLPTH